MRRDVLWKGIVEDLATDFLRFFFVPYLELFDLTKPVEFLDQELLQLFPAEEGQEASRYVDKLMKVSLRSGERQYVLLHLEVQAYQQEAFAARMFDYYLRITTRFNAGGARTRLPFMALAILSDPVARFAPTTFHQELAGTEIRYTFPVYKILDQSKEDLLASNNPFALVILTCLTVLQAQRQAKQTPGLERKLAPLLVELARLFHRKNLEPRVLRALNNFLKRYVRFQDADASTTFVHTFTQLNKTATTMGIEEQILDLTFKEGKQEGLQQGIEQGVQQGIEQGVQQGIEQGIEQGAREAQLRTAREALQAGLPLDLIQKLSGLSADEIVQLREGPSTT